MRERDARRRPRPSRTARSRRTCVGCASLPGASIRPHDARVPFGYSCPRLYLPVSQPPLSGLHTIDAHPVALRTSAAPRARCRARGSNTAAVRTGSVRSRAARRPTAPRRSLPPGTSSCRSRAPCLRAQIGEHRERLFDFDRRIGPVDLVQVDVVGAEAAQALLDFVADPAAGVALPVHAFAHLAVHFGREHHVVAAALQRLADDLLRLALRVHVGGVDEVDAVVERVMNDPHADRRGRGCPTSRTSWRRGTAPTPGCRSCRVCACSIISPVGVARRTRACAVHASGAAVSW